MLEWQNNVVCHFGLQFGVLPKNIYELEMIYDDYKAQLHAIVCRSLYTQVMHIHIHSHSEMIEMTPLDINMMNVHRSS